MVVGGGGGGGGGYIHKFYLRMDFFKLIVYCSEMVENPQILLKNGFLN